MGRALVLWLSALAAGCPTRTAPVTVIVRNAADQQPVAGVTVGWVCTPSGAGAAVSDDSGAATVVVFNSKPEDCIVTIARIGFKTLQLAGKQFADLAVLVEPSP